MTLDFQLQQVPFTYGLAEGTDPHAVPFGVLTRLENYRWKKHARLEKRYGVTALGEVVNAARLFARGSELCAIDGTNLWSLDALAGTWKNAGKVNEIIPTSSAALDTQSGVTVSDLAYLDGVLYYAWTTGDPWNTNTSTDLWFQAVSASTGQVLYGPSRLSTGTTFGVRVLVSNTNILVLTRTGAASPFTISAWCFNSATRTFLSAGTALAADNATTTSIAPWDACMTDSSTLVIGYNRTGAVIALESFTVSAGGAYTPAASGTVADAAGCRAIAIDGIVGERLYVVYAKAGVVPNVFRIAINDATTLAQVVAPATVDTPSGAGFGYACGVARFGATQCVCWYNVSEASTVLRTVAFVRDSAGAAVSTTGNYYAATATTRPFALNGKAYFGALLYTSLSGTVGSNSCLLSADEYRYLGTIDVLVGGFPQFGGTASAAVAIDSTTLATMMPFQADVTPTKQNWRQGARLVQVAVGATRPSDAYRSIDVGQEAFVSGGGLVSYDGSVTFDYGFPSTPVLTSSTVTGAGSIAAGTYLYASVTEFRSSTGLYYRSPAAAAITQATTTSSSTNTVLATSCQVGNKPNSVVGRITEGVYRSVASGTVLHRLSFEPRFNTVYVDRSAVTQSLSDARADSDIDGFSTTLASRPALYTTGGILDDYAPPANHTMFGHVDRLFVLACDKRRWWFSKTFQDDLGVAPGFHPDNTIVFEEDQTCGGSLDDKAIFFSENRISYTIGFGPGPNGQGGEVEFTTPIKLQTDAGCTQPRSLVSTPDGLMYRSPLGIHLLTRGLEVQWLGRSVQDDLDAFPTVTSATLVPYASEVRFTCSDGTNGIVLVYNYVEKQWSTAKYLQDADGNGVLIVDACMHAGAWTFVTSTGKVYKEDTTTYLDDGSYVPDAIETAWVSSGGPVTYQSVRNFYLLGRSHTDHTLRIECAFDSEDTYVQSRVFPARSGVTEVSEMEDVQISIGTRRKCSSIRFRISSSAPTALGSVLGIGQGPSFETMGVEVGIKRGSPTGANKKG